MRKESFEIGMLLLPITVLIVIIAPLAGRVVDSRGAKLPILAGLFCLAVSAFIQSTYKSDSSLSYIIFGFIFMGVRLGIDIRLRGLSPLSPLYRRSSPERQPGRFGLSRIWEALSASRLRVSYSGIAKVYRSIEA
ncbi:MAG: hypothetical protein ACHQ6U_10040 [Thermodesulfobacteriota bacterium]